MEIAEEFSRADARGAPTVQGRICRLKNGGVLAGWYAVEQGQEPLQVSIHHGLGAPFSVLEYWFWDGTNSPHVFRWSGKRPHPDEAGPVQILNTGDWLHFHFEPGKPVFARYELSNGRYDLVRSGWLGVLLLPG